MTRQEFIDEAKRQGKSKEETFAKFQEIDAAGRFDDSKQSQQQDETLAGKINARNAAIEQGPTLLGQATQDLTGNKTIANIASQPEKAIKSAAGAVSDVYDLAGAGLGGINNALGGIPGAVIKAPLSWLANAGNWAGHQLAQVSPQGLQNAVLGANDATSNFLNQNPYGQALKSDVGAGMTLGSIIPAGKGAQLAEGAAVKAAEVIPAAIDKTVGKLSAGFGGVKEEALRAASTPAGRQAIAEAAQNMPQTEEKLVAALKNPTQYLPEAQDVRKALRAMPDIQLDPLIQQIDAMKIKNPVGLADRNANKTISGIVQDFQDIASGNNGKLSADELFDKRMSLDDNINWSDNTMRASNEKLKEIRSALKDELITASTGTGYEKNMQLLADKLDKIDKAKKLFGGNIDLNAESVLDNLFNRNKRERQEIISNLTDVFGNDFYNEIKNASYAKSLGNEGNISWLPMQTTGKATLGSSLAGSAALLLGHNPGAVAAVPIAMTASPKIATHVTLPLSQFAANAVKNKFVKHGLGSAAAAIGASGAYGGYKNGQSLSDMSR
jgi:hypothetical protein